MVENSHIYFLPVLYAIYILTPRKAALMKYEEG